LKALKSDPTFHKTYYHFGLLYYIKAEASRLKEDYYSSEKYLLKATSIKTRYGKAYLLLAKLQLRLGNTEKAKLYAQSALKSGLVNPLAVQAKKILSN
jgi:tetratricopeptide (TPR) repeat protein